MTIAAIAGGACRERAIRHCAIVGAMREELGALLARITVVERSVLVSGCPVWHGRLGRIELAVACTGVGRGAAWRGAAALLALTEPDLLAVVGSSGALSPGLSPGAVFVARGLRDGPAPGPAPALERWPSLLALDGVRPATFVTSPRILSAPSDKAALGARTGGGAALVDLETAGYADAARAADVPWIGLRSVCDAAEEPLPFDFEALRDEGGGLARRRIAVHALVRPRTLPALWSLRARVRSGAVRVAAHLASWLGDHARA
jgi:nucleoside phosphorylase